MCNFFLNCKLQGERPITQKQKFSKVGDFFYAWTKQPMKAWSSTFWNSWKVFQFITFWVYYRLNLSPPLCMQLQFSLAIIHCMHSLYINCNFPKWMHYTLIGYATSFIILFTNFYLHTYVRNKNRQRKGMVRASCESERERERERERECVSQERAVIMLIIFTWRERGRQLFLI